MAQFIMKYMSNTLPDMTILQQLGHATTNLFPCYGLDPETIQHMYQCTHGGRRGRWTALLDTLQKQLEARNTDPDIAIILVNTLLYIAGERNDLPQYPNLTLHSEIFRIGWPLIVLGFIPTSLARTEQTYFTHTESKKRGLKWASQIITQIWKLICLQWLHYSQLKQAGEVQDDHTKELILSAKIIDKHKRGQYMLPYHYNPYFSTPLYTILYTLIKARNKWYSLINTALEMTITDNYTIFSASKPFHTWIWIQSSPSLSPST